MRLRQPLQIAAIIVASVILALVSNAFASRDRKLILPGYYPDAMMVPREAPQPRPAAPVPTETVAPAPAEPLPPKSTPTTDNQQPATTKQPPTNNTPAPKKPAPVVTLAPHPDKPYVEISGDTAAAVHRQGVLFLDARRTSVYEDGHIAGARPFSVWESDVDEKVNALFNERSDPRDQNLPIVVYCSGGECEDSHMLAQKLWGVQFNNVYVYKDGFPDWQKRGGAVRKGAQP